MTVACDHSGLHSGEARYLQHAGELRLVLVCDACGVERTELRRMGYRPDARCVDGLLAELTARELGLGEPTIARVRMAALLRDVGREQIPPEILNKQGPLDDQEWAQIRRQPELGAALLTEVSFDDIREWIRCHHERPDGHGYPRGLVGDQIPLEARIVAVIDAYTAMTSDRPYRTARSHEDACAEFRRCAGTQFDAAVVQAFLSVTARGDPRRSFTDRLIQSTSRTSRAGGASSPAPPMRPRMRAT
jgi:HD-GYP domain-containing protein (c-di-GMP phosphodiesterase class II)